MSKLKDREIIIFNKENYDLIKKLELKITNLEQEIIKKQDKESNELKTEAKTIIGAINEIFDKESDSVSKEYVDSELAKKQNKLEAGANIDITKKDENIDIITALGSDNFYGYVLDKSLEVNDTKYIYNDFDNNYWHLFNVEYIGGDKKNYSGSLERPANITLDIIDCNVGNDFGASSSATITFNGNTKTLEVKRWEQTNLTITRVNIFKKLLFKADIDYETKADHLKDIELLQKNKQDLLIDNGENQNIKTINGNTLLGQGDITVVTEKQFTDNQVLRLVTLLKSTLFGYNKINPMLPLEFRGHWTPWKNYSDLDRDYAPDNMLTDEQGNPIPDIEKIREITDAHYSGNAWRHEDGSTSLRDYQGKITYDNKELIKEDDIIGTEPITVKKE